MRQTTEIPSQTELMWPTLQALAKLGGSASNGELNDQISIDLNLSDDTLDMLHGDGSQTEFAYRSAWARTFLRQIGAIENPLRGVWTVTGFGRQIGSPDEARNLLRRHRQQNPQDAGQQKITQPSIDPISEEESWKSALLKILRDIDPDKFERLCQLLLRHHGFDRVEVTGRSGDGGIDGTAVLSLNLISFSVIYQCKRYSGMVPPFSIRDFRGAMVGRADKGLFITTGTFTNGAKREAIRDGAAAIDLIDGDKLCELLRDKGLGVVTETIPNREFFNEL